MKWRVAIVLLVALTVAFLLVVVCHQQPDPGSRSGQEQVESPASAISTQVVPEDRVPVPPGVFKQFGEASPLGRKEIIRSAREKGQLDDDERVWLKRRVRDRSLDLTNRNDMASLLVWQEVPDPTLYRLFLSFYRNNAETAEWRDYSVQFIGQSLRHADNGNDVKRELMRIGRTDKSAIAGTAMLQLAQQESQGHIRLGSEFDSLVEEMLQSEGTNRLTKMSAVAVVGLRRNAAQAPAVRQTLRRSSDPGVRRASIGTLGIIGGPSDVPLVESYLDSKDALVATAAEQALKNLRGQTR